jgi:hypothetical protein
MTGDEDWPKIDRLIASRLGWEYAIPIPSERLVTGKVLCYSFQVERCFVGLLRWMSRDQTNQAPTPLAVPNQSVGVMLNSNIVSNRVTSTAIVSIQWDSLIESTVDSRQEPCTAEAFGQPLHQSTTETRILVPGRAQE